MAKAVDFLARQTVAGLGGTAMKTCLAYIKNALLKPEVCIVKFFVVFLFFLLVRPSCNVRPRIATRPNLPPTSSLW